MAETLLVAAVEGAVHICTRSRGRGVGLAASRSDFIPPKAAKGTPTQQGLGGRFAVRGQVLAIVTGESPRLEIGLQSPDIMSSSQSEVSGDAS